MISLLLPTSHFLLLTSMSNHLEEIKLRVSIEDLVGSYVQLKKAGRNLKGLCPFHGEKTPSFMVSPEKGIAYCFGCHQGGDIFKFMQLAENISFQEATKLLAERAGVRLPQSAPREYNKRLQTIEINQATLAFYQKKLAEYPEGQQYFLNRGLSLDTLRHFQLGFAPDSFNELKNVLIQQGFHAKDLIEAAVLNQRSIADQNSYDRFRNRLIFPLFDHQGNPVGFSGRIIGEGEPKYLNSPETPAYNKSMTLYGLNLAKESIKKEDLAIFVEGYMDVIATHQAGTQNTIATCGTAITPQQLKLISRYTQNIAFAFDQDSAGMEATLRAIELAQLAELNIKIVSIPCGKDPDECVQKDPEAWRAAVQCPMEVMDFYFSYMQKTFDLQSIQGVREALSFILPLIKTYKSDVERGVYLNQLAVLVKTDVKWLWNDLKKIKSAVSPSRSVSSSPSPSKKAKLYTREEMLLSLIFAFPHFYEKISCQLVENLTFSAETERFYKALKKVYTRESSVSAEAVKAELDSAEDHESVDIYALLAEESYGEFSDELLNREAERLIKSINKHYLKDLKVNIKFQLQTTTDKGKLQQLMLQSIEADKLLSLYN